MPAKKKRLTLDLEPSFHRRLKAVAALKGVTMRQYCIAAIDRELARDESHGIAGTTDAGSDAARFEALQQKYSGDHTLPFNAAELVRQAREERDAQLEGLA